MMRRRRPGRSKFPAFILGLAGILICVTCMSAETLLVILSLLLIALEYADVLLLKERYIL